MNAVEEKSVEGHDLLESVQRQIISMQSSFILKEGSRILKSYPYRFFGIGKTRLLSIENHIMELENVACEYNSHIDKERERIMNECSKNINSVLERSAKRARDKTPDDHLSHEEVSEILKKYEEREKLKKESN